MKTLIKTSLSFLSVFGLIFACIILCSAAPHTAVEEDDSKKLKEDFNNAAFVLNPGQGWSLTLEDNDGTFYEGAGTIVINNGGQINFQFSGGYSFGTEPSDKKETISFSQDIGAGPMDFVCVLTPGNRANCRGKEAN